jgi:hypothetical protein
MNSKGLPLTDVETGFLWAAALMIGAAGLALFDHAAAGHRQIAPAGREADHPNVLVAKSGRNCGGVSRKHRDKHRRARRRQRRKRGGVAGPEMAQRVA